MDAICQKWESFEPETKTRIMYLAIIGALIIVIAGLSIAIGTSGYMFIDGPTQPSLSENQFSLVGMSGVNYVYNPQDNPVYQANPSDPAQPLENGLIPGMGSPDIYANARGAGEGDLSRSYLYGQNIEPSAIGTSAWNSERRKLGGSPAKRASLLREAGF